MYSFPRIKSRCKYMRRTDEGEYKCKYRQDAALLNQIVERQRQVNDESLANYIYYRPQCPKDVKQDENGNFSCYEIELSINRSVLCQLKDWR